MPYATASEAKEKEIPGRWIAEDRWPGKPAMRRYYLNNKTLGVTAERGPLFRFRGAADVGSTKPEWLDRLPIEQSADDKRSLAFDSEVLSEPLEILGTPEVKISVATDTPVATLMVRLTELRPDGSSWLVTWAALNLTRRDSMAAPKPLEPDKTYAIPISLRTVAHRFGAGSRIRLAISEGSWPMLWPSPVTPELRMWGGVSTLELPVRPMEKMAAELGIEEIHGDPAAFADYQAATAGPDGRVLITTSESTPPYPAGDTGIEMSSSNNQTCEIRPNDPLSAAWRQSHSSTWKHDKVTCRVDASYELTADAENFHLTENLSAYLDGTKIFERSNMAIVTRDLM